MSDFDDWWAKYPRKIGKLAAEKAYAAASKKTTPDELIAGIDRYLKMKPAYADFCHPRTWLMQGRWMDGQEAPEPTTGSSEIDRLIAAEQRGRGYRIR